MKLDRDDLVEIIYQSNLRGGLDTAEETLCNVLAGLVTILQQEGYWRAVPISVLRALAEPEDHQTESDS